MSDIDVVILWVDGGDPVWIKAKNSYQEKKLSQSELELAARRYRDWDNLEYLFRSIEKFMPWVRRVHFVTNGQKPEWLNEDYEKLNWVKHEDFIPQEYLPTFSANPIELNIHRIEGLAEKFIYLNDDMFITRASKPTDFFSKQGLPMDQSVFLRIPGASYRDIFGHILLNDIGVINQNFSRKAVLRDHYRKLFSFKNGLLSPLLSATYLPTNHFPGFMVPHMPQAYLKSTFNEVWSSQFDILHQTSLNKFPTKNDVNQYIFREWQFVTGNYAPTNILRDSAYFSIFPKQLERATTALETGKYRMVCINDSEVGDFETTKTAINQSLGALLADKSRFEI